MKYCGVVELLTRTEDALADGDTQALRSVQRVAYRWLRLTRNAWVREHLEQILTKA